MAMMEEGAMRQMRHAVKAGGNCRKVGVRRPQLDCGCSEATDMAEGDRPRGAAEAARGARDPFISPSPALLHRHRQQCMSSSESERNRTRRD